jgi:hypothetical protein
VIDAQPVAVRTRAMAKKFSATLRKDLYLINIIMLRFLKETECDVQIGLCRDFWLPAIQGRLISCIYG